MGQGEAPATAPPHQCPRVRHGATRPVPGPLYVTTLCCGEFTRTGIHYICYPSVFCHLLIKHITVTLLRYAACLHLGEQYLPSFLRASKRVPHIGHTFLRLSCLYFRLRARYASFAHRCEQYFVRVLRPKKDSPQTTQICVILGAYKHSRLLCSFV